MKLVMDDNSRCAWGAIDEMAIPLQEALKSVIGKGVSLHPIIDAVEDYGLNGLDSGLVLWMASEHGKPLSTCEVHIRFPKEEIAGDPNAYYQRDGVLIKTEDGNLCVYSVIDDVLNKLDPRIFLIATPPEIAGITTQEVAERIISVHCTEEKGRVERYVYDQGHITVHVGEKDIKHPFGPPKMYM